MRVPAVVVFRFPEAEHLSVICFISRSRFLPVSHFRDVDLSHLRKCRDEATEKISWPVLFIKAYALIAGETSDASSVVVAVSLGPHLYQHPHTVAMLSVKRSYQDQEWLFFASFDKPDGKDLPLLQNRLENYCTEPVEQVFKRHYKAAHLPTWIRRTLMWIWLNWMGERRARKLGTFGLTTVGSRGAVIQNPPGMLTATMTYGPFDESGKCRVTIAYDHRLMDGWYIAEILEELETTLNGVIADELSAL